jgi:hypothetical protein
VQKAFLDELSEGALLALPFLFEFWALPHQLPPEGDWKTWVILGGRGAGKTRAGAEWVRSEVEGARPLDHGRSRRVALVGETIEQAVTVMVEGESGILACSPPDRRPLWDATRKRLLWPNGAEARVYSAHDPERLRGPQFDAAWVDEYGCPAVDKGPNQPNKFVDPKSSESSLPKYSTGQRDDLVQMQYVRAVASYWSEGARNPVSPLYGGRMVDMDHAYLWAWDARPYPWFPALEDVWSDGENYRLGHWMTGRAAMRSLASVVSEICARAGLEARDTSELYGLVRGYVPGDVSDARAMLQPLMLAFGFDAAERDGQVIFRSRGIGRATEINPDRLAVIQETPGDLVLTRISAEESAARIKLIHVDADGNFDVRSADAGFPDVAGREGSRSELPLALTADEAGRIVERWVAEARVSRDRARFALPPGIAGIGAGDTVELPGAGTFRLDAIEEAGIRLCDAVRMEPGIYRPVEYPAGPVRLTPVVPPLPVEAVFLDLPLLSGDEDPAAPYVAATATPWTRVAVYSSSGSDGFSLDQVLERPTVMGVTESDLTSALPGRWDRGAPLRLRLFGGGLSSVTDTMVFAGANAMAIGDGVTDDWEVFQFANAELLGPNSWSVSRRLRGQAGTEGLIRPIWPSGSRVVLLDRSATQLSLPASYLGIERIYRFGPARRPPDDLSYRQQERTFRGVGLRPYAPVHLRARRVDPEAPLEVTWVRRTRIAGDRWDVAEVPLGEMRERYLVRVTAGGTTRRTEEVSAASWSYPSATQAADGVSGPFVVEVAQISDRFGPGLYGRIDIDG